MISPVYSWVAERTGLGNDLSPDTLRNWQLRMLEKAIQYARRSCRFYRERINDNHDLEKLPFTLPTDLANDPYSFLAIPQSLVTRVTTLSNSGTTSLRKRVFFSGADIEKTKEFFAAGMSTMVHKGDHAQILISNNTENSLGNLLREGLAKIGVTSEITAAIKTAGRAVEASRDADCLIGMPAEILYMSRIAPCLRPRSVLLAADIAPRAIIESIKETWQCEVFTHYGHSEFGYGCAVDCEFHDGLHTRDANLIFEIINPVTGMPANPGESGEIVITTLSDEAMPLIRYRTGNMSHFISNPCKCGGTLQRLGRIEGRMNNLISAGYNKTLNIYQMDEIIFANPDILGYNAIFETGKNTLHLVVESKGRIDTEILKPAIPEGINVSIRYESADPFSHRGKRRIQIRD